MTTDPTSLGSAAETPLRVLVCGSRSATSRASIGLRLAQLPRGTEVIHGGARGTDRIAAGLAGTMGLSVREFKADWPRFGRRAGILRNLEMLDEKPDLVIAFWDGFSRGTKHTIDEARKRGIETEVWDA